MTRYITKEANVNKYRNTLSKIITNAKRVYNKEIFNLHKHSMKKNGVSGATQSLTCGIFPNSLEIAKVAPIIKKENSKLITNYRSISVLLLKYMKLSSRNNYVSTL